MPAGRAAGPRGADDRAGVSGPLLAALAVIAGVEYGTEIYRIVFVVVLFSVLVQGSLLPFVAKRLRVPMRRAPEEAQSYE